MMCKYCEGDVFTPIYESKNNGGMCELGIVYDAEGHYINCYHEVSEPDAELLNIFPRIYFCPMCGRELAGVSE